MLEKWTFFFFYTVFSFIFNLKTVSIFSVHLRSVLRAFRRPSLPVFRRQWLAVERSSTPIRIWRFLVKRRVCARPSVFRSPFSRFCWSRIPKTIGFLTRKRRPLARETRTSPFRTKRTVSNAPRTGVFRVSLCEKSVRHVFSFQTVLDFFR